MNYGCIILAGGQSSRMGTDKRQLRLWGAQGPRLLEHMLTLILPLCSERIVVLNDPEQWPDLPADCIPDAYPGAGPLGGLASGLAALKSEAALLLACDTPFIPPTLLAALLAAPLHSDVRCLSRPPTGMEPFSAVYHRRCLTLIETLLARGERRMSTLLTNLNCEVCDPSWWQPYDSEGNAFINLNRAADLTQLHERPSESAGA